MRKGLSAMSSIMTLIILLVILFLLSMLVSTIMNIINESVENNSCKQSVTEYAAIKKAEFKIIDFEIDCPTKRFDGLDEKNHFPKLGGSHEELKKQIADEMYYCWDNYGRGELDLFVDKDQKFCAYCSYIEFEEEEILLYNFLDYLMTTKTPKRDKTYFDFFSNLQITPEIIKEVEKVNEGELDKLNTSETYAVLYTHYTKGSFSELKTSLTIAGTAVTAGFLVIGGAALSASGIGAIPGAILITAGITGGATVWYATSSSGDEHEFYSTVELVNTKALDILNCEYLPIKTD